MAGYKGHLRGGMATVGIVLIANPMGLSTLGFTDLLTLSISTMVGSLLPDIDHPQSVLGRRLPFISNPIHKCFGHRSITHSIFFLSATLLLPIAFDYTVLGIGLSLGTLSHILLDFLCMGSGVAFLYPVYKPRIQLFNHFKKKRRRKK